MQARGGSRSPPGSGSGSARRDREARVVQLCTRLAEALLNDLEPLVRQLRREQAALDEVRSAVNRLLAFRHQDPRWFQALREAFTLFEEGDAL